MNATPLKPIVTAVPPTDAELRAVRATPAGWNDQREAMAKRLFSDLGWSASQTATAIGGGLSRNAVIGKAYRANWAAGRDGVSRVTGTRAVASKPRVVAPPHPPRAEPALRAVKPEPVAFAPPAPEPPMPDRVHDDTPAAVLALRYGDCRWPIGDPAKAGFRFCCRPKRVESPYCGEHGRAAFQPAKKHATPAQLARSLRRFL